jgi:hypothetical protein
MVIILADKAKKYIVFLIFYKSFTNRFPTSTLNGEILFFAGLLWFAIKNRARTWRENHESFFPEVFEKLLKKYLNGCLIIEFFI